MLLVVVSFIGNQSGSSTTPVYTYYLYCYFLLLYLFLCCHYYQFSCNFLGQPSSGKVETTILNPDDGRNASYFVCCMIFWATRRDGEEFYKEATSTYIDLMPSYSNKIKRSMNILVRRIILSGFYKNAVVRPLPHSFQDIHYPTFDFSDLYLSEYPDFSNVHLYGDIETCGLD